MKTILTVFITLASVVALADIPNPGKPRLEPGQPTQIDTDAATVLVYGVPVAKLTALKKDTNTLSVERQNVRPGLTRYVFLTKQCINNGNRPVAPQCIGGKQLTVTRSEGVVGGAPSYDSSEVVRLRGQ